MSTGNAFPLAADAFSARQPGMTLRDYFASMVMSGFCADGAVRRGDVSLRELAQDAYDVADEMLEVRG